MTNITFRQLRYFEALARHGHFGKAAEACAISQPALSMQVKELEESLGASLIERQARSIRLTELGSEFVERTRHILRSVDELEDLVRASQTRLAGRLRIGIIPTVAPYLLPNIVRTLNENFADIDLHIRETITPKLLTELREGRIDAAIVALPVSEPSMHEVALFSEQFLLVRPATDADKPVPDREKLREMRLLLLEEGHCFRDQALSFCSMQQTLSRELLEGSSLSTLVQMVSTGIGVTLIPEMALAVETSSANVAISVFKDEKPTRTIGMIWRKTSPLAHQLTDICEIVRLSAQKLYREQAFSA